MPSTTLITTSQLARPIGVSQAPAIVDVRIDDDYHGPLRDRAVTSTQGPGKQTRISSKRTQRLNLMPIRFDRRLDLQHDFVNILKLAERERPSLVIRPPVAVGLSQTANVSAKSSTGCPCAYQPERLMTKSAALWFRLIGSWVLLARIAEELSIAIASMKCVGLVEAVARLMAKNRPVLSLAGASTSRVRRRCAR
jgi:hypothetical protein